MKTTEKTKLKIFAKRKFYVLPLYKVTRRIVLNISYLELPMILEFMLDLKRTWNYSDKMWSDPYVALRKFTKALILISRKLRRIIEK